MKRYWAHIVISETGDEEWEGDVIKADEVEAERAKDRKEIEGLEFTICNLINACKQKDKEIARLRKALENIKEQIRSADLKREMVQYIFDSIYEITYQALARIAELEGKNKKVKLIGGDECEEDLGMLPRMPNKIAELEGK